MTQTANYEPGWFKVSNFRYKYMAADIMVAQIHRTLSFARRPISQWSWIVFVSWNGEYLKGQCYYGFALTAKDAMKGAEKRMYGTYWM
jgi:hypothetical protein